jgi:hypothetical protein
LRIASGGALEIHNNPRFVFCRQNRVTGEQRKPKMKLLMMDSFQNPSRAKNGGSEKALVRLSGGLVDGY